jgi:aspartate/methionine/tyrosine aminotransferase
MRIVKRENPEPIAARAAVRALTASKIRELFNAGVGRKDIVAFWVGEPDEPTPEFIRKAGIASIEAGELFYSSNFGIAELREALAAYLTRLHRPTAPAEIVATSAGVNALMLVSQLLVDPGDRVVEVVPLWPNLQEIPKILNAQVETVALEFSPEGWRLDLGKLLDALEPGTKALYLNSPNNPTGWTVSREEQRAILDHCRRHGIWIFADDAYERLYYEGNNVAPSFLDIAEAGERVISTNTFSKSWLMTGWRLGWIGAARGAGSRHGQARRVQHLLRARLRPARRSRRGDAGRAGDRAYARALPQGARLPRARAARDPVGV